MKALVTGAAGFIGSHLAEHLLNRGFQVVGLDCFTDYYARSVKEDNLKPSLGCPGFTFIEGRLQDVNLTALLEGVTFVFHLAAQAGVRKSWGKDFRIYTENNIDASQRLLEACIGQPIRRFVYSSTSSVYGDNTSMPMREDALPQPISPYGATKLAAEHLCHLYAVNYQVPTTSLRYFTVYGPRQRPDMAFHRFIRAALMGAPLTLYGDGEQTRDFTFVTDVVAANLGAAERGVIGRAYNIGGGSRVSVNRVLEIIAGHSGRSLNVRREATQKGDMRDTWADTTLAARDLGFTPSVSIEEGIAAEYEWLASSTT